MPTPAAVTKLVRCTANFLWHVWDTPGGANLDHVYYGYRVRADGQPTAQYRLKSGEPRVILVRRQGTTVVDGVPA